MNVKNSLQFLFVFILSIKNVGTILTH